MKPRFLHPWLLATLLWCAVLASAAGSIYSRHRSRELFVELERLNREHIELDITWGKLQLEQSSLSTPPYVGSLAATKLRMVVPDPNAIQVVVP